MPNLDPGKATAILWKAIYHLPILSFRTLLVLSHSPLKPKMSSFQWAFFFCPTALACLSDVSQIEIRPKGQNCYRPPAALLVAASGNTEKKKHELFKDGKKKRSVMECVKFNLRTDFINTSDNQCRDTNGEFEEKVMSHFLFFLTMSFVGLDKSLPIELDIMFMYSHEVTFELLIRGKW